MLFMGRGFNSEGQKSWSAFDAVVTGKEVLHQILTISAER